MTRVNVCVRFEDEKRTSDTLFSFGCSAFSKCGHSLLDVMIEKRTVKKNRNDEACSISSLTRNRAQKPFPRAAQKQRKKPNVPLGKSRARSAVCIFALVTLSFAIKIRPTTAFENRSSTFGPISAHRFVPTRLHSSLVRSTCKTSRASSLAATSVANGARSLRSSPSPSSVFLIITASQSSVQMHERRLLCFSLVFSPFRLSKKGKKKEKKNHTQVI